MKKFLSSLLCFVMIFSMYTPALAASNSPSPTRINRAAVDKIHGNAPVMTESEAIRAADLIAEKETLVASSSSSLASRKSAPASTVARISSIDSELEALGAVPLTIEDIYALHGLTYVPGAPDVPGDTNYVHFYGINTYIGNYDVYSIVAGSTGFSQTDLNVPFYKADDIVIFDKDAYAQSTFSQYIDMAASVAGVVFEDVFEKAPILNYVSDVWTLATYFNPTAQQKFTINYTCGQTYIFSYVADKSVGYYDFTLTAERKQGNCTFKFEKFVGGNFTIPPGGHNAYNFEALSKHWADYSYAVDLYQDLARVASYVGDLRFLVNNKVAGKISMAYYSELWSIPGI